MDMNRRKLFAAGGFALVAGGGTGAFGAEVNPGYSGITIQVRLGRNDEWEVAVPDWEQETRLPVHRGFILPVTFMPLTEFLEIMKSGEKDV